MSVRTHAKEVVDKLWHLTVFCTLSSANRHSRQSSAWIRYRINHFSKEKKKFLFSGFLFSRCVLSSRELSRCQYDLTVNSLSGRWNFPAPHGKLFVREWNCSQLDLTVHSFSEWFKLFPVRPHNVFFFSGVKLFPARPHGPFFLWGI